MSVLIKDMEMPNDCATCHFCHTENFRAWCCITDEDIEITDMTKVQEDCPLSEAPEPCEDAVSRTAVQYLLAHFVDEDKYVDACDGLKHLPPVTPKQRTGHWYPVGMVEAVGGESAMWGSAVAYHKCSECDELALQDDFEQEVLSEFCPHCGAKMTKGDVE